MMLAGKTALVTGAGSGIGAAIARAFAAEGARVVLADVNEEAAAAVAGSIGPDATALACDVTDRARVRAAVAAAEAGGGLDIAVANAGIIKGAPFLEFDEADFDRVLAVNLKGAFLTVQEAARAMAGAGRPGSIIAMASMTSRLAIPEQVAYACSKGGVEMLVRTAAVSLAPLGIRVNAIAPGSVDTPVLKAVMADEAARRTILSRTPLGRLATPEDIAKVALFLASDLSGYVTGETVFADGGRLALNYTVPVREG